MGSNTVRNRTGVGIPADRLLGITVMVGIFAFLNTHPIRPHDFWWHLKAGEIIDATGRIPTIDTFSHIAAGRPYPYSTYWFAEWGLHKLYALGGAALVVLANTLIITAAYAGVHWACRLRTGNRRVAAGCVLFAAALGIDNWNVRPQTLAILCFATVLAALVAYESTRMRRWLLLLPLAMLVWVNSHGSFPIGLALLGLWLLTRLWEARHSDSLRKSLRLPGLALVGMLLAVLANPRGIAIVGYLRELLSNQAVWLLSAEWAPATFAALSGKLFFGALAFAAIVLVASPLRARLDSMLLILCFAALAVVSQRHILWFGMVAAVQLAPHLQALASRASASHARPAFPEHPALNMAIVAVLVMGGLLTLPWLKGYLPLPSRKAGLISGETPVDLAQAMQTAQWPQPIFNDEAFGSYLIWAAAPNYPVFIDPRIDLYSANEWLDYLAISTARFDWESLVSHYGIQTLVLSIERQPDLIRAAAGSSSWQQVYEDHLAIVFTRERSAIGAAHP